MAILFLAMSPSRWTRATRNVLARQIMFTGVGALAFVAITAILVGFAVVVQAKVWLARMGQTDLLGPLLVAVVVRELGPLLVNLIVIGRSGTAIASELASMRVAGEIEVLDSQGLDPTIYLLMPRSIGLAISVFGLSLVFIVISLLSGFVLGHMIGVNVGSWVLFADSVTRAISGADVLNFSAKTLLPGLMTGILCSSAGLRISGDLTQVPQAATRGVVFSVGALFLISALVSLLTYL